MRILVLGTGKTGKLVAEVAAERGHNVHVLGSRENKDAAALTAPFLTGFDIVIDFTTPDAVVANMRACLAAGTKMVVGTTGWYDKLSELRALAEHNGAGLLYGTNFSIGVQKLFRLTAELAKLDGYQFHISETHHESKIDVPSGTAITLQQIVEAEQSKIGADAQVEITSRRVGDTKGEHIVIATGPYDTLELRHDAHSRRGFALGAVRAAEWLAGKQGAWEFREIFDRL